MKPENNIILKNKFQDVYDEYLEDMPGFQDMDFSSEFDIDIALKKEGEDFTTTKRKKRPFIGLKVASFLLLLIFSSSFITIIITNGSVEAGKDKVWDFFHSLTGDKHLISDEEVFIEIQNISETEKIKQAKDIIPSLLIEDNILDGLEFEFMTVEKFNKNDIYAMGSYSNDQTHLSYSYLVSENDDSKYIIENHIKEEQIKGGTLLLAKDVDGQTGENSVAYIKGNIYVIILGNIELNELKDLMNNKIIKKI